MGNVIQWIKARFDRALQCLGGWGLIPPPIEDTPADLADPQEEEAVQSPGIEELLDDIDRTIKELKYPAFSGGTDPSVIKALNAVGPMVVRDAAASVDLPVPSPLPTTIFVAYEGEKGDKDWFHPSMFFAVKIDKKTIDCAHLPGVVYECGLVFPDKKATYWLSLYMSVVEGRIIVADKIPQVKHIKIRGKDGTIYIPRKVWGPQTIVSDMMSDHKLSHEEARERLSKTATFFFHIWKIRLDYWRVSARRDGKRVTFLIKEQDPKKIFKDRDVVVRTPTGQKKRIIHHVTEHARRVKGGKIVVKEHLRGLRQFPWKGTNCAVLAPQFHKINTDHFTTPAVVGEKQKCHISGKKLWRTLAHQEDQQSASFRDLLKAG